MRRREFLTLSATSIGGMLVYSLDRKPFRLSAQTEQSVRIPLRFFTQPEALIVAAAASRIVTATGFPLSISLEILIHAEMRRSNPKRRPRRTR